MKTQTRIWTEKIKRIVRDYRRLNSDCEAAAKAGCLDINGPLYDAIWRSHAGLLSECDFAGWIEWFIYDNGCGKKKMKAKFNDGRSEQISTPAQLAKLIVKTQSTR